MARYRIFTNDVGPDAYSCFESVDADSAQEAVERSKVSGWDNDVKVLAIPESRPEDMPDGQTGKLSIAAKLRHKVYRPNAPEKRWA
jgi:hypothetical protein